jgi:undecaprenyl diphosphate synthase
VEQMTQKNKGLCLNIALNYGGRDEILHAVAEIARDVSQGRLKLQEIDSRALADRLYTKGIPDPDLLIRTSGEKRASNFLLWQLAYTEFWYTDILWPDIREQHIVDAIFEFQNRNRRFGGV